MRALTSAQVKQNGQGDKARSNSCHLAAELIPDKAQACCGTFHVSIICEVCSVIVRCRLECLSQHMHCGRPETVTVNHNKTSGGFRVSPKPNTLNPIP